MLARCTSAALRGLDALPVSVEVDLAPGLPALQLVGLADAAVLEARERVRAALRNSGLRVPLTRIVVSLAPADLRKAGPSFDLPIALGLLVASGQLPPELMRGVWSAGELGLDGGLRPVRGMLAIALAARRAGARALLVPEANAAEAALTTGLRVWGAADLVAALAVLRDPQLAVLPRSSPTAAPADPVPDLDQVRGQPHGRRALEIAAAGGHHLLLVGPPGSGKTMLARRLAGLLPPLSEEEALELTGLYSVAGLLAAGEGLRRQRPFRSPHHGCSAAALIGGGAVPRPGELSLAHHGVLFLDELGEFSRPVLDQLRQPLEEGRVSISRARQQCSFPCRITLVAATNPCPCGWDGDPERCCRCGEGQRQRYWGRLSGPLLDRLDLQVVMRRPAAADLAGVYRDSRRRPEGEAAVAAGAETAGEAESSASVSARVRCARARMGRRNPDGCVNAQLSAEQLPEVLSLAPAALDLWEATLSRRGLSARAAQRLLRVALTIADLAGRERVETNAIAEALSYRSFDLLENAPPEQGAGIVP